MKISQIIVAIMIALCGVSAAQAAVDKNLSRVNFSDGSIAMSQDHCGDTDLCATVMYPNGDKLSVYSEGAALCQPYMVNFVRTHGTVTMYQFTRTLNHEEGNTSGFGSRCGESLTTQMVMDHGLVHMTISENHDGTLKVVFAP